MYKQQLIKLIEENEIELADFIDTDLNDNDCLQISEALLSNNTCYKLKFGKSKKINFDDYGLFLDSITNRDQINIYNINKIYSDASQYKIINGFNSIFESLKYNNTVTILKIKNYSIPTNSIKNFIDMLKTNKSIQYLHITSNLINNEFIEALQVHNNLTELKIDNNIFNNNNEYYDFLKTLSSLKYLYKLDLCNCKINNNKELPQTTLLADLIEENIYLSSIKLSKSNIIFDNLSPFFNSLLFHNNLTHLNIEGYHPSAKDDYNSLIDLIKINTNITYLNISNIIFEHIDELIDVLSNSSINTLKMKNIKNLSVDHIINLIQNNPNIYDLDISKNNFTNKLSPLLCLLQNNNNLTSLNISYISIGRQEIIDLYDLILKNKTLFVLNVNYCFNNISNTIYILDAVKYNKILYKLYIYTHQDLHNYWLFNSSFVNKICNLIEFNKYLTNIYIDESNINIDPEINSKLTEKLMISYNQVYSSLLKNKTLVQIVWSNLFKAMLI